MEYGIANEITFLNNIPVRTPIGYVVGSSNVKQYNVNNENSNPRKIIEVMQFSIPEGLNEIIINN